MESLWRIIEYIFLPYTHSKIFWQFVVVVVVGDCAIALIAYNAEWFPIDLR